jgi:peptidoglycan/LPS O-acetylase OafA/YrhL
MRKVGARISFMESDTAAAREALDAVRATRELNAERLRRPKRYWIFLGLMLSVFALLPYTADWPPLLQYVAAPALMILIAVIAGWKQPTAVRKIRLSGRMTLQLLGFAIIAGVVAAISRAVYLEQGWWWAPLVGAVLLFAFVTNVGPRMDRSWARRASHVEE